jgi:TctA family transporter
MAPLAALVEGLGVATQAENLLLCAIGVGLGTLVGVLPGLGPVATIAILLPAVFHLPPAGALMMLAGIYYGAQYGSSTTAILLRVPGEASGVVTMIDGHALARKGRAGPALVVAALASLVGGIVAAAALLVLIGPLARLAVGFGPAATASLFLLGAAATVAIQPGPLLPAWSLLLLGALLGFVGTDVGGGRPRFTFGIPELGDGIGFAPLATGLFGVAELIRALAAPAAPPPGSLRLRHMWPDRGELADSAAPALRGSLIGCAIGVLPGATTLLAALAAYAAEKGLFRRGRAFGQGEIGGVAAPEAANNAASQACFAPLLALGLPANAVTAILAGAMLMIGAAPGPAVMLRQPELVNGLIASMLVGNAILVVLNLPFVGLWAALLRVPMQILAPPVLLACCVGVWAGSGSLFDVWLMLGFGVLGWLCMGLGLDPTPLLLGFVLGPGFEEAFRRALVIARGDWGVFLVEPGSSALLAAALLVTAARGVWRRRWIPGA